MRIIVPPKPAHGYVLECCHCHAVVGCQKDELGFKDEPLESFYVLTCPVAACAKETWIKSQSLERFRDDSPMPAHVERAMEQQNER